MRVTSLWFVPVALLAGWLTVAQPLAGVFRYRQLLRDIAGDPTRRLAFYRRSLRRQWLVALGAVALALAAGATPRTLGLRPRVEHSAELLPALAEGFVLSLLVVVLLRWQRRRMPDRALTDRVLRPVAGLLPQTPSERRAFALVAVTAGVTEELLYRGFLVAVVVAVTPGLGFAGALVVSSAFFGAAHAYQGLVGIVLTGLMGAVLASLYLLSGSLLLPMAVHALVDLRILLLLPTRPAVPPTTGAPAAAGATRAAGRPGHP
ncbi:MAG: CPBP family intramembrane metalloprotease [Actinomycetota bacterium]|nr:CPBP family intramembrane metalloprotease [Actinomycetota bacterium]